MARKDRWIEMIIDRIATLLKRRKAAAGFNVRFDRSASFRLPYAIRLAGQTRKLKLPDENGVKVAFIDLLLDDCYGCRALKKRGEKIETVLDIGGNVGLFGIAARNAFPRATIHSYEPNRQLEPYLSVQAKVARFDYFMEAVGLKEDMISLDLNEDSVQTRSKQDGSGNIPQIAFAKAIERLGGMVDLLKMDCEGAEWEIFKDQDSWKMINNLSMEYHLFESEQTQQRVKETIISLGFTIKSFVQMGNCGLLTAIRNR